MAATTTVTRSIVSFVTGRRTKWVVVLLGFVVAAIFRPLGGKQDLTTDPTAFLPANAQSTQVVFLQRHLPSGQVLPAVVVYASHDPLSGASRKKIAADTAEFRSVAVRGIVPPPEYSADNKAAIVAGDVAQEERRGRPSSIEWGRPHYDPCRGSAFTVRRAREVDPTVQIDCQVDGSARDYVGPTTKAAYVPCSLARPRRSGRGAARRLRLRRGSQFDGRATAGSLQRRGCRRSSILAIHDQAVSGGDRQHRRVYSSTVSVRAKSWRPALLS